MHLVISGNDVQEDVWIGKRNQHRVTMRRKESTVHES